ncbi:hypothetical protein H4219_000982 [Mycoemilia scoparia]|uniref:Tetratricopeptide repeat protein n=1 Tax=Mycoemilia scoparia TaxID=417184 RepID=A0A9W8DVY5_9FUNG|nr:hypothetical protein H4219_000982 [Mycoemilia scoparia]
MKVCGSLLQTFNREFSTSRTIKAIPSDSVSAYQSDPQLKQILRDASSCLERGDLQSAIQFYQKAAELDHTNRGSYIYNIAVCYYQLGKVDVAISKWEESLKIDPGKPDTLVNLGNIYVVVKKDANKAIEYFQKAIELAPNDGEIAFNYACTLEAVGKLGDAAKNYEVAHKNGIEKAGTNLRNVMAKILKEKLK